MISVYFTVYDISWVFGHFQGSEAFDSWDLKILFKFFSPCHYSVVTCLQSLEKAGLLTYLKFENRLRLVQPQNL
jgi:hypothetical protein